MTLGKPYIALIDADMWTYDIPFAAQRKTEEGEEDILPFDYCSNLCELRLKEVLEKTGCTEYEFYLTGGDNFRHALATIQPYKGNRQPRPFHYRNMRNYLMFMHKAQVIDGMEADDMLAIRQTEMAGESVIVSRDKDLRTVEGWHYSYALSTQPEKPLEYISDLGYLTLKPKNKLVGGGHRLFYAQCLMGDKVDNIQGLPKYGPVKAFNILKECENEEELYAATFEAYKSVYADEEEARKFLHENAKLLWMIRDVDENNNPVMWRPPNEV